MPAETVRSHLEAIRDDSNCDAASYLGEPCDEDFCSTCDNRAHAKAALSLLDATDDIVGAGTYHVPNRCRLVPDPGRAS